MNLNQNQNQNQNQKYIQKDENRKQYSEEQAIYIHYMEKQDTKLLATAGSGKTFCIIHRIRKLIDHHVYSPHHIFMLTFSKNAKEDFILKLKKHKVDEIPIKNINTIDSFAYAILGENISKSIDVSILSYSLLCLLKDLHKIVSDGSFDSSFSSSHVDNTIFKAFNIDIQETLQKLKRVKCVFIDESQDLNETQYKILIYLKMICPCELNFIGDPNQNIYQFRNSSDKYLVNYQAKTFYLTKNYRSQGHIVEFCSNLRPYNTATINFENEKSHPNLEVTFYTYKNSCSFENFLLSILHFFKAKNIPFHKVAILAPTRGYLKTQKGICQYKGLCYVANLLYKHEIPFQQFYNDMGNSSHHQNQSSNTESDNAMVHRNDTNDTNDSNDTNDTNEMVSDIENSKISYKVKKGHINLMTYTASKGLEWDYVIIIDANAHLISRKNYDLEKYKAEKYLLYVACSRPRKNLIIFTKHRFTNPWFKDIPQEKYRLARICDAELEFYDTTKLFDQPQYGSNNQNDNKNEIRDVIMTPANEDGTNPISSPSSKDKMKHVLQRVLQHINEENLFEINKMLLPYLQKETYDLETMWEILDLRDNNIAHKANLYKKNQNQKQNKMKVPDNRQGFCAKFLEHFLYVHLFQTHLQNTHYLKDIKNVVHQKNILYCSNEFVISWYFKNRDQITWPIYDDLKDSLPKKVTNFIDAHFDRAESFSSYTLVDKFYNAFVDTNFDKIKEFHQKYLENAFDIRNILFMSLISYAIESTHYFYILQDDIFYNDIVSSNIDYLTILSHAIKNAFYGKYMNCFKKIGIVENINAYIDFELNGSSISLQKNIFVKLKCVGDEKLRDILFMIILIYCERLHHQSIESNDTQINIAFFTFMLSSGKLNYWNMNIPCAEILKIIEIVKLHSHVLESLCVS